MFKTPHLMKWSDWFDYSIGTNIEQAKPRQLNLMRLACNIQGPVSLLPLRQE